MQILCPTQRIFYLFCQLTIIAFVADAKSSLALVPEVLCEYQQALSQGMQGCLQLDRELS